MENKKCFSNQLLNNFYLVNLQVIKTERDYQNALMRLEIIFDAKKGSTEGDELELLSLLIDNYEKENQLEDFRDSNS